MSTYSIDSARTSEILSAFLSEIGASKPIDQFFTKTQALNNLWGKKKVKNGGRQIIYPANFGKSANTAWYEDLDPIAIAKNDTAKTVGYAYKNLADSIVISKQDLRETSGDKHKIFDLLEHKRNVVMMSVRDKLNVQLFSESVASNEMHSLFDIVKGSGELGGLTDSTYWVSTVTTSVGDWATNGMDKLRALRTTIRENKGNPDTIITHADVFNAFEANLDVDVRYSNPGGKGERGFTSLAYAGMELLDDGDCKSDDLYMLDTESIFLVVDSDAQMSAQPFQKPVDQFAQVSLVDTRLNLITTHRRGQAKLEGITV